MTGDMAEQLERLLRLQEIDSLRQQIHARVKALEAGEPLAALRRDAARLAELLDQAQDRLTRAELEIRQQEGEAAALTGRRKELEDRLYGGGVVSTKEVEKLQAEIAFIEDRIGDAETAALEAMELAESLQKRVGELDSGLRAVRARLDAGHAEIDEELAELRPRLEKAEADSRNARQGLERQLLTRYDRMAARIRGPVIVPVGGQACGGCDVTLSVALLNEVRKKDRLHMCENCGRGLVWTG